MFFSKPLIRSAVYFTAVRNSTRPRDLVLKFVQVWLWKMTSVLQVLHVPMTKVFCAAKCHVQKYKWRKLKTKCLRVIFWNKVPVCRSSWNNMWLVMKHSVRPYMRADNCNLFRMALLSRSGGEVSSIRFLFMNCPPLMSICKHHVRILALDLRILQLVLADFSLAAFICRMSNIWRHTTRTRINVGPF